MGLKKQKNNWAYGTLISGLLTILIDFVILGTGGIIFMFITFFCAYMGWIDYKDKPEQGGKIEIIIGILFVLLYVLISILIPFL